MGVVMNDERYFIGMDGSGHRYLIPLKHKAEWDAWSALDADDECAWDEPDFAQRIDGGLLTFTNPEML